MLAFLLGLVTLGCLPPSLGSACSCPRPSPDSLADRVEAVFVGTPVKVTAHEEWYDHPTFGRTKAPAYHKVRFRILYSWKEAPVDSTSFVSKIETLWRSLRRLFGQKGHIVTVWTGAGGGDCGIVFEEGHYYLVFTGPTMFPPLDPVEAATLPDQQWTGICNGTVPIEDSKYDQLILGDPVFDHRLPGDTLTLWTSRVLSAQEKLEVLAEAAMQLVAPYIDIRGKDPDGNYVLWYRPNPGVQWVPAGFISGPPVDQADWSRVTQELRRLRAYVAVDYASRDWKAFRLRQ